MVFQVKNGHHVLAINPELEYFSVKTIMKVPSEIDLYKLLLFKSRVDLNEIN